MSVHAGRVPAVLDAAQRAAWERALAVWGVQLHDPRLVPGEGREVGAPAWFGFPPEVSVDPEMVAEYGASDDLESVFAHEIGHHVLAPSTRTDGLATRHQIGRALQASGVTVTAARVGMLANLWNDLLVNTRLAALQRARDERAGAVAVEPGIVRACRRIFRAPSETADPLWWVYLRVYELSWGLTPGILCAASPPRTPHGEGSHAPAAPALANGDLDRMPPAARERERALREAVAEVEDAERRLRALSRAHPEADALALSRLVRTFAHDPVSGALRFGLIVAGYLDDESAVHGMPAAAGLGGCATDGPPTPGELGRVLADTRLRSPLPDRAGVLGGELPAAEADDVEAPGGAGQSLGLAETLAVYTGVDPDTVVAAWYRTEAARWVRPLRTVDAHPPARELIGPIEQWDLGDDLAEIDWPATMQSSPVVIPGVSTRRRSVLADETTRADAPVELDLYIDSSGSMDDPRRESAAVLAGMILALSVLRGGGRMRATSFSGPGQVAGTAGFVRNTDEVAGALTRFFGGGTSFPLDLFAERYAGARAGDGVVRHLVVLSDDGLDSMFGAGNAAYAHVAASVRPALTSATLVLQNRSGRVGETAMAAGYDFVEISRMSEAPGVCARLADAIGAHDPGRGRAPRRTGRP